MLILLNDGNLFEHSVDEMKSVLFWGNQLLQFLLDKGWERGWIGGGDRRRWDIERLGLVVGQLLEGFVLLKELDQL